jgi:hypothetical protein
MVDSPSAHEATIVVTLPGEIDLANAVRVSEELNAARLWQHQSGGFLDEDPSTTMLAETPRLIA